MTRLALLAPLALLLLGTAAPPPSAVPLGKFETWGVHPATPLHVRSGGLTIDVVAQPCLPKPQTEGCTFDGVNNQATITVTAPGLPPFSMTSDRQASFVRVAAVHLDRRDARPGVVVDNQWGGSGGITKVTVIEPVAGGFRAVPLQQRPDEPELKGEVHDFSRDLSGDDRIDFVVEDAHFGVVYECNACTPQPPLVLTIRDGRAVDISADPHVRAVFARDMTLVRPRCLSTDRARNGACAAYVGDAARTGALASAWRAMLAHYERHPGPDLSRPCVGGSTANQACAASDNEKARSFPKSLRAFLVTAGYITPAQAASLPLPAAG
jgi:hypothetical protein